MLVTLLIAMVSIAAGRESVSNRLQNHVMTDGHSVINERVNRLETEILRRLERIEEKVDDLH